MFSPSRTPPPDSSSEEEEDLELPTFGIGTPQKVPKLETSIKHSTVDAAAFSTETAHVTSLAGSSTSISPFKAPPLSSDVRQKVHSGARENEYKSVKVFCTAQATRNRDSFRSIEDELEAVSPLKTVDRHKGVAESSKKMAKTVKMLSKSLKEKNEMERKLELLRSMKGIQGIIKEEEEKSAQVALQQQSPSQNERTTHPPSVTRPGSLSSVGKFFSHSSSTGDGLLPHSFPTNPPGRSIFIHEPSLITELYPPGIEVQDGGSLTDLLMSQNEDDLKSIVCGQMLALSYTTKPCPVELRQWLFQLMACSNDPAVSSGALRSLTGLLQNAKRLSENGPLGFSAPSMAEVTDVLMSLGADRARLRPQISRGGTQVRVVPPVDVEGDEVFSPARPPSINLINLTNYISACIRATSDYTLQDREDLALILSSLSLDHYCSQFLVKSLRVCLHQVLVSIPKPHWHKAVQRLSPQLLCVSQHHHDQLFLARLLRGDTQRQKYLTRDFCRRCLVQMLELHETAGDRSRSGANSDSVKKCSSGEVKSAGEGTRKCVEDDSVDEPSGRNEEEVSSEITQTERATPLHLEPAAGESDSVFLKQVLESCRRILPQCETDEDYYRFHSLLLILQLYAPVSALVWPSEAAKQQCIGVLGALRADIKENPMRPLRSVVKDRLIHMTLELQSGRSSGRQTDLFSFCS